MYHENKWQLEEYKRDILEGKDYTVSDMPRGGMTSDNTYSKCEKLMSSAYIQNTERMVKTIEKVLNSLDACRYRAIDMLYIRKTHTVVGVSLELHASESTVYNWINSVITLMGKDLGLLK